MDFWKSAKGGGGSFSIQRFILQILETGLFEHEIDTNELFQGSGYVISTILLRNQNKTHFEEGSSSHSSLKDESGYQSE